LGPLPATVTVQTGGGGRHLYFSYPSFEVRKDTAGKLLGSGLDVMSDGGFVVAPPSRHASGKRYRWQEGRTFDDLDPAALPDPWLSRLRGKDESAQRPVDAHPPNGKVTEGTRNSVLTSAAGRFRNAGMDESQICAALVALNSQKCAPPLDLGEVAKISTSVARYAVKPFSANADLAEQVMRQVLDQHFAGGKHLLFGSDGQFWTYDGRKWHPVADAWLRGRVFETLETVPDRTGKATSTVIGQVQSLLEAKLAVVDDPLRFLRTPLPVINCANGELWIGDDGGVELRPHIHASYLRHCLDVAYDPAAKCPKYDSALRAIFSKASDPKSMVRHWNELTGYIISSRRNIPLIVVLQGGGGNGKTRLMQTVSRLLGRDQVCAIRIETLGTNRFIAASLLGKSLLLDDDVRAGIKLPDGELKKVSEEKEITGERKFGDPFNFVGRALPILACNGTPSLSDMSHGMLRRLMVIPFDRTFTQEDRRTGRIDDDPALFPAIWATEMPGVLNRALRGLRRLMERGGFRHPQAVIEAKEEWLRQANPLPAFIEERCSRAPEASCLLDAFYRQYSNWTREAGYTLTQQRGSVRKNLEHLGF